MSDEEKEGTALDGLLRDLVAVLKKRGLEGGTTILVYQPPNDRPYWLSNCDRSTAVRTLRDVSLRMVAGMN